MDNQKQQHPEQPRLVHIGNTMVTRREAEDLRNRDWSQLK